MSDRRANGPPRAKRPRGPKWLATARAELRAAVERDGAFGVQGSKGPFWVVVAPDVGAFGALFFDGAEDDDGVSWGERVPPEAEAFEQAGGELWGFVVLGGEVLAVEPELVAQGFLAAGDLEGLWLEQDETVAGAVARLGGGENLRGASALSLGAPAGPAVARVVRGGLGLEVTSDEIRVVGGDGPLAAAARVKLPPGASALLRKILGSLPAAGGVDSGP